MGILKRISDLARAQLNSLVGQLEDPKKLAAQAVLDLEASKKKAEQLTLSVAASLKRAERQLRELPAEIVRLAATAEAYVKRNDEENARTALKAKHSLEMQLANLEQEIAKEKAMLDSLQSGIDGLKQRIGNLKTSSTINAGFNEAQKADAFDTFSRMEEKIEAQENELAAFNELLQEQEQKDAAGKPPATSFDKHSDPDALERELLAIKRKFND